MEIDELKRGAPEAVQENEEDTAELDLMILLVDFYKGLKKFWWVILILALGAAALTLFRSVRVYEPQYRAEATFTVATRATTKYGSAEYSSAYEYGRVTQMAQTFPYILGSDILQQIIKEDLGVPFLNGSINAQLSTDQFPLPILFRVGLSANLAEDFFGIQEHDFIVAVDAIHPSDNKEYLNVGAEYTFKQLLSLRGGYRQLFLADSQGGLTLGMGLHARVLRTEVMFDYAMIDYGLLDKQNKFSLIFAL